jgi:hypothetical protein
MEGAATQPGSGGRTRARRLLLAAACGVALFFVGISWALASPVGSSPDDDFHLASIWCDAGDPALCRRTGVELEEGIERVLVAPELSAGMACFRFDARVSAACQERATRQEGLVPGRANDGLYPDGFYRLMSLLATDNVERSAIVMRMVSWVLALTLLGAACALAGIQLRRAFVLGLLTTLVPLGVFLFASNNPSGVAVAGVAAYWCAAYAFMSAGTIRDPRSVAVVALVVVSSLAAVTARSDAGLFLVVASVAVWISTRGDRKALRPRSLVLVGVSLVGATAMAAARQSQRWSGGLDPREDQSLAAALFESALDLPRHVLGALGPMELGWLDTPMPPLVTVLMLLAFGGAVLVGLGAPSREKWLALGVIAGTIVVVPLIVLTSGQNVQGRYVLPALPVLVGTAVVAPRLEERTVFRRGQAVLIVVAVVIAHSAALHQNIRRYVTGMDEGGPDLGERVEWWWSTGPGPMATWLLGTCAFALAAIAGWGLLACERPSLAAGRAGEPSERQESANRVGASSPSSEPVKR